MTDCKHTGDHVRQSLIREPSGFVITSKDVAVVDLCLDCGAWLSLGPATDTAEAMIEVRAAEIAAEYVPDFHDALFDGGDSEAIGWACHRDDDHVPRSAAAWSGWLARQIYDHDLVDDDNVDRESYTGECFEDGEP